MSAKYLPRSEWESWRDVYLRSPEWAALRSIVIERACDRCQVCNAPGQLDVHHRTYERFGAERIEDLIALCRECHELFHKHRRLAIWEDQEGVWDDPDPTIPGWRPDPSRWTFVDFDEEHRNEEERLNAESERAKRLLLRGENPPADKEEELRRVAEEVARNYREPFRPSPQAIAKIEAAKSGH